jgi:hypothetical protein
LIVAQGTSLPLSSTLSFLTVIPAVIGLVPCTIMSVWTAHPDDTPLFAAYASYFMTYVSLGTTPLVMSWLSDLYVPVPPSPRQSEYKLKLVSQIAKRPRSPNTHRWVLDRQCICRAVVVASLNLASIAGAVL